MPNKGPHKGYKFSPEVVAARLGRKASPETRAKMSVAGTDRQFSLVHRANLSAALRGNKNALGHKRPPEQMLGSKNPYWHGGRYANRDGYVLLRRPDSQSADCRGYVYEHRLVMETILGRRLLPAEIVHHLPINGDKADNRKENLALCNNRAAHRAIHSGEIYLPI